MACLLLTMPLTAITNFLVDKLKDDVDVDTVIERIGRLLLTSNSSWGLYCLEITSVGPDKLAVHSALDGHDECDFVLIKFGYTVDYTKRFPQFGFEYTPLFKYTLDSKAEDNLKQAVPANFKNVFWSEDKKCKVGTVKLNLTIARKRNPGPTEWRLVTKAAVQKLKQVVADLELTAWNYEEQLKDIFCQAPRKVGRKQLLLRVGNFNRRNMVDFDVWDYQKPTSDETDEREEDVSSGSDQDE